MKKRQAMTSKNYNDEQNVKWLYNSTYRERTTRLKNRYQPINTSKPVKSYAIRLKHLTFVSTVWYHENEQFTINMSKIHYQFVDMSNSICNLQGFKTSDSFVEFFLSRPPSLKMKNTQGGRRSKLGFYRKSSAWQKW